MKFNHHYHFYSRVFISLLIFSFGFFLWQKSVDTRALVDNVYTHNTPIVGWAYNDSMGWIAMSCANDFNGDGEPDGNYILGTDSCVTRWGLKMASSTIDDDGNLTTPKITVHHVQGCAWAGNIGAVGGYESTTPGWICFSNPPGASTAAPTDGVLMTKTGGTYSTCDCEIIRGTCPVGSPINSDKSCFSYGDCTGTNTCVAGSCSISNLSCSTNFDCQVACESGTSAFLGRGVCFDHSSDQEIFLGKYRGYVPPFTGILTDDSSMTLCYINKDCVAGSECVYPQYGILPSGGTGKCMIDPSTEQSPSASCVYDFDCVGYCALELTGILPNAPTSCLSASCIGGYEKVYLYNTIDSLSFFNALSTSPSLAEGFASIVKLESVTTTPGYEDANKIGFPIQSKVENKVTSDPVYDPDNPNNEAFTGDQNPIRGCFNCYKEKSYRCTSGTRDACSCDQSVNSCWNSQCDGEQSAGANCSLAQLKPAVCENCQEYFYFSEHKKFCSKTGEPDFDCTIASCPTGFGSCIEHNKFCSIRTDFDCTIIPCPSGFGSCGVRQPGELKKVLTGFNCTGCTIDNENNSCALNAENINSNRCQKCRTFAGVSSQNVPIYDSNVYRIGGVLYDNQHGRSSTSTLCGWGYNAWQGLNSAGSTVNRGFGWINFSPRISNNNPYFSVEKGNIYSKGNISSRYQPPINKYNASYLIEAGGTITNFVSEASKQPDSALSYQGEMPNRPIINFLRPISGLNTYTNALGKLDFNGLVTIADGGNKNKYGSEINFLDLTDQGTNTFDPINSAFNQSFANKIYYVRSKPSNYAFTYIGVDGTDLIMKIGTNANTSGAGIIVVNGNLKIAGNVKYDTASVTNIKQIPSLVWIVKGDVTIDSGVTEVAGTFIVLGDGGADCSVLDTSQVIPRSRVGCGQFRSLFINDNGTPVNPNSDFLKIKGNVLARKFVLVRRKTNSAGEPAEQFINDGRLQANPPLGLKDMSKVIPRFSSY